MSDTAVIYKLIALDSKLSEIEHIHALIWKAASDVGLWCWEIGKPEYYVNQAYRDLFELTDEITSTDWYFTMIHPDDVAVVKERIKLCIEDNILFDCNYRFKCPSGWKMIKSHGSVVTDEDGRRYLAGINIRLNNVATPSTCVPKEDFYKPVVT